MTWVLTSVGTGMHRTAIRENKMRDTFKTCHPIVNFTFFCIVILCGMFFMHPVLLSISVLSAFFIRFI